MTRLYIKCLCNLDKHKRLSVFNSIKRKLSTIKTIELTELNSILEEFLDESHSITTFLTKLK